MEFINRETEMERLKNRLNSKSSEFITIYGRRRIGKSELVKQVLKSEDIYFQATESTPELQLNDFIEAVQRTYPEVKTVRQDWEAILEFLADKDATLAIDEFPFLVESDSSLPSIFQRFWDNQESEMNLVLIGSSISIMEDKVLSSGSPLYGRWTDRIDLQPLGFQNAAKFFPNYSAESKINTWSVFGGTPHYLKTLNPEQSFQKNVTALLLDQQGRLFNEPEFLLRTELSQPQRYMAILKSIAAGNTTRNRISNATGIENSSIGTYLSKLERLRLVEREVPVTEEPPRSRKGRYRIMTPLVRFWFRFIYGNEDTISLTDNPFHDIVKPELNDYVSRGFEDLCIQKLPELTERDFEKVGRWWHKEHEIDVAGIYREGGKLLGECKYTNSDIGLKLLRDLEEKKEEIRIGGRTDYALFSKSGFTERLRDEADERGDLRLFKLKDLTNS
ncbi:MAG: ATP-binding protein [Candidatus Nanohalobium sp.]